MSRYLSWVLVIIVGLTGCRSMPGVVFDRWQTYRNPRFEFEFLYPDGWVGSVMPENRDGMAFAAPTNPEVEIRGWAELRRPGRRVMAKQAPNFKTEQGVEGRLNVKVEAKSSSMTVTLQQGDVEYNWQGIAPSQQFDAYYRFFYYVASRYRIPKKS